MYLLILANVAHGQDLSSLEIKSEMSMLLTGQTDGRWTDVVGRWTDAGGRLRTLMDVDGRERTDGRGRTYG